MYGSAGELLENINIYKDFPATHKFFGTCDVHYQTRPRIFTSFNNEKYIAKSDLFVILQNMILPMGGGLPVEASFILDYYLKSQEEKVRNSTEFLRFDEKRFNQLEKEIKEEMLQRQLPMPQKAEAVKAFSRLSNAKLVEKFQELIPGTLDERKKGFFEVFVDRFTDYAVMGGIPHAEGMAMIHSFLSCLTKSTGSVIDRNPELFLPRGKDSKKPITVRVFEDGDQHFLMKSEISNALIANSTLKKSLDDEDDDNIMHTISLEEVLKNFDTKNIQFIRFPITRAKHRATPIPQPTEKFPDATCILAIDAFFEFFKELTLGLKFYQKKDGVTIILPVWRKVFQMNCTSPCFVHRPDEDEGKRVIDLHFENFDNIPAKDIRNVGKDGFTLQDLKNELAYLGLTTNFKEIQSYAEDVYSEVDKRKRGSVLRTCDLFDAIEHCQLNAMLEKHPDHFKKFVHKQKGCHRVYGLKCEDCAAENPENQEDQKLSILEKKLTELKIAHQKMLEENQQKSLEIQELKQKNLRLSVKNETNEVKMKQLIDKLDQSKLSIDDGNYSTTSASNTSPQKIQCLICEKSIESGEDQIIRCPLCKRRFHSKCAITWLKEHQQCPACNGDLPKF